MPPTAASATAPNATTVVALRRATVRRIAAGLGMTTSRDASFVKAANASDNSSNSRSDIGHLVRIESGSERRTRTMQPRLHRAVGYALETGQLLHRYVGEIVQDHGAALARWERRERGGQRDAVGTRLRCMLLAVPACVGERRRHAAPAAGGEIPSHPSNPGDRVVVPRQGAPSGVRPAKRLLDHVLRFVPVAEVRVQLDGQRPEVSGEEIFEL